VTDAGFLGLGECAAAAQLVIITVHEHSMQQQHYQTCTFVLFVSAGIMADSSPAVID
jgi:hypothetical protein